MRILVKVDHPGHVHLFKNLINILKSKGNEIKIVARDKDVTLHLLKTYNFQYEFIDAYRTTKLGKVYTFIKTELRLFKIAKKFNPDILIAVGDPYIAHVGSLLKKISINFTDTENARLANRLTTPFATVMCTPSCFKGDFGYKHVRYNGYHELAYLHPTYFKPDRDVLKNFDINENDKFIVLRCVSWKAVHDIWEKGFVEINKVVKLLEKYGKVLITSENKLPSTLEKYRITIPPEKIHHLLYFASLYLGESATMASECVQLGTPSILVSTTRRGYTDELENKYGLVYNYSDSKRQENALKKAVEILENENSKKEWKLKREKMLDDKVDVTKFMVELIESYG